MYLYIYIYVCESDISNVHHVAVVAKNHVTQAGVRQLSAVQQASRRPKPCEVRMAWGLNTVTVMSYGHGHLLIIATYKWDYKFYIWGFLELIICFMTPTPKLCSPNGLIVVDPVVSPNALQFRTGAPKLGQPVLGGNCGIHPPCKKRIKNAMLGLNVVKWKFCPWTLALNVSLT